MLANILRLFDKLPKEWITLVVATLPISELRGAIPLALAMGIPILKAYWLAVLGNIIPIAPLLIFLEPVSACLRRFRLWRGFFEWLFESTERRTKLVQKYGTIGLALFVAIPLPATGAWTGCVAASLFKLKFLHAFIAITIGVLIAGIIVAVLSSAGIFLYNNIT